MSFLIVDLESTTLNKNDIEKIQHPNVVGIILFTRNFKTKSQLKKLVQDLRSYDKNLLVSVDYEGGRVQRFKEGFTPIPPMRLLGSEYEINKKNALLLAKKIGWVISKELGEIDIDFSFTPVLDIDYASSSIIGDRAFHFNCSVISELANSLIDGLFLGGMQAVGKHFPGHGFIKEDTHLETAIDSRKMEKIVNNDIKVFLDSIKSTMMGIMSSHVIYENCDKYPSTFSKFWINNFLKRTLNFKGLVFSDDLSMKAAIKFSPDITCRVNMAFDAGIDIALICNSPEDVSQVLRDKNDFLEIDYKKLEIMRLNKVKNKNCTFMGQSLRDIQEEIANFTKKGKL